MAESIKTLETEKSQLIDTTKQEVDQLRSKIKEEQTKLASSNETVSDLRAKIIKATNQSMELMDEKHTILQTISSKVKEQNKNLNCCSPNTISI